jgi:putative transposase
MQWPRLLAYITGRLDKELQVRNEYLAAENRILRTKIKGRLQLSDGEKRTLSEIAHRLERKALAEVAVAAKPDTILHWFRKLVACKFDGSACRQSVGRPRVEKTIEDLIVRITQENPSSGYDRMVGALANLGHIVSDQTVGNVLKRHGISPAPKRKHTMRWRDFIRAHMETCWSGPTSSPWKSLPSKVWSRTTCLSSSSWRHGACAWRGSRPIRTGSGWSSRRET